MPCFSGLHWYEFWDSNQIWRFLSECCCRFVVLLYFVVGTHYTAAKIKQSERTIIFLHPHYSSGCCFYLLVSQRVCIHVLVCVSLLLSLGKAPERLRLKYALFFAKYSLFVSFVEALNQPPSSSECGAPPWHCISSARALCVRSAHVQKPPFKTDFLCRAFLWTVGRHIERVTGVSAGNWVICHVVERWPLIKGSCCWTLRGIGFSTFS